MSIVGPSEGLKLWTAASSSPRGEENLGGNLLPLAVVRLERELSEALGRKVDSLTEGALSY